MTKLAVRQLVLGLLVILNGGLLAGCIFLLRSETTAAVLFAVALIAFFLAVVISGLLVTAGSRDSQPYRLLFGYSLWASYRSTRFYTNVLWMILLFASTWLVGPHALYRIQVTCEGASAVTATSFLGREMRAPCASTRTALSIYQPLKSVDSAKDRISCLDSAGASYAAVSQAGPTVTCNTPPNRSPLRVDRMEPPAVEANRIRRYRLYGSGLSRDVSIQLDSASFVGSSVSRDSDRHPAEVAANGEWMDIFMSVMQAPGREKVRITLSNERNQAAELTVPIQVIAQR